MTAHAAAGRFRPNKDVQNVDPGTASCNTLCIPSEQEWAINGFERIKRSDDHSFFR